MKIDENKNVLSLMEEIKKNTKDQPGLRRTLSLFTGILMVAGSMIGTGVFKKIVPMAQSGLSETGILSAWIIAGLITMLGAFVIAALSAVSEESGGVYEYLRLAFGNFFSFLFGWSDFSIIGSASIAAVAFIFAQTINSLWPLPHLFQSWETINIGNFIFPFADCGIKILAIAGIVLLTWFNYRGVKNGGLINNIFTLSKIAGILLLIILGLLYAAPRGSEIITLTDSSIQPVSNGIELVSALFGAMLSAFWAYDGWINLSFISGEIKNPRRNIPLAIIAGVCIAMFLYVLINYAYMHVLSLRQLAAVDKNTIGAVAVAESMIGSGGRILILLLIMISTFGTLSALILAHSRVQFRMAQEGWFFRHVAKVHPVYRTPSVALLYTMVWSCVLVISGTFDLLTDLVIFTGFVFYAMLAFAVIRMKRKGLIKNKATAFSVIPGIFILFSLALLINTLVTQPKQSAIGMCLVLSGVLFYFYFKKRNTTS